MQPVVASALAASALSLSQPIATVSRHTGYTLIGCARIACRWNSAVLWSLCLHRLGAHRPYSQRLWTHWLCAYRLSLEFCGSVESVLTSALRSSAILATAVGALAVRASPVAGILRLWGVCTRGGSAYIGHTRVGYTRVGYRCIGQSGEHSARNGEHCDRNGEHSAAH